MASASPAAPIRIEIRGAYRSIDDMVWDDVPPFVVLTGLNGSGKTHLLELLAYKLTGAEHPEFGNLTEVNVTITGAAFEPDTVAYIPSHWSIASAPTLRLSQFQDKKDELWNQVRQTRPGNIPHTSRRARLARMFDVNRLPGIDRKRFMAELPEDFAFMLDDVDVAADLAYVFLAYRVRVAEAREQKVPEAEILTKLGPAPWDVVNETFAAADFPFRVASPTGIKLLDQFALMFEDIEHGHELRPMDLSSGERILLGLVLWLYNSGHHGRFPKLFLLDEPDAHLHPSMTRHYIDVLLNVMVKRYGVRVILTTHSPSTVALAPEAALFEMRRSSPRIVRSQSKAATVGLLTAGLVTVSPSTRFVFAEDDDDVAFFTMVQDVLSDYGPTRDPRAMKPAPSVTFVPASVGTGRGKIAGGKSIVTQWLDKLNAPPLDELFRGVIDRDSANTATTRLLALGRYSIENYYVDPLYVFAVLSDAGTAPSVPDVTIAQGQEHLIRSLPKGSLQQIVDVIANGVVPTLGTLSAADSAKHHVTFTNGITLDYPAWFINRSGHDLMPLFQQKYGGPKVISPPRLSRAFKRVRLIPTELADIMDRLQS